MENGSGHCFPHGFGQGHDALVFCMPLPCRLISRDWGMGNRSSALWLSVTPVSMLLLFISPGLVQQTRLCRPAARRIP